MERDADLNQSLERDDTLFYTKRHEVEERGVYGRPEFRRIDRTVREWREVSSPDVVVCETVECETVWPPEKRKIILIVGIDPAVRDRDRMAAVLAERRIDGEIRIVGSGTPGEMVAKMLAPVAATRSNDDGTFTHSFRAPKPGEPGVRTITVPVVGRTMCEVKDTFDHLYAMIRRHEHAILKRRKRARLRARGGVPSGRPHKRRK